MFEKLRQYQDKIHVISDIFGSESLHPLARTLRNKPWKLVPYQLPLPPKENTIPESEELAYENQTHQSEKK
jgi:hypothetical protein